MNSIALTGREPGVRSIISAGFPGYNGKRITCEITEKVHPGNTYWDGGSRYQYSAVHLGTFQGVPGKSFSPFEGGVKDIDMTPGVAVLEHHSFSCQDFMRIYVHPSDAPRLLPAPSEISREEKIVLVFTRSLKNSYAGEKEVRFKEAQRETNINRDAWDTAKAACITKGLLNRAGAITPDGRNAAGEGETHELGKV